METTLTVKFASVSAEKSAEIEGRLRHLDGVQSVEPFHHFDRNSHPKLRPSDKIFLVHTAPGCKHKKLMSKIEKLGGIEQVSVGVP